MKQIGILSLLLLSTIYTFGQTSNGRVSSLVAAENYFSELIKEKGIREGFLRVSNRETVVFRPGPVKAENFYSEKQQDPGSLSWEPAYAKISRSGDWGFSTGPYVYTSASDNSKSYGQYLSVWKADRRGVWKLALDLGTPHPKPTTEQKLHFTDPDNFKFFRQISPARLQQRRDMIMTTDRLMSTTMKKNIFVAYDAFLATEARLIFPGHEPLTGKDNISKFIGQLQVDITTEPAVADRSIGSDLAFTYGKARITKNDETKEYNYIRIWESQEESKWNVIVEMYSPAE